MRGEVKVSRHPPRSGARLRLGLRTRRAAAPRQAFASDRREAEPSDEANRVSVLSGYLFDVGLRQMDSGYGVCLFFRVPRGTSNAISASRSSIMRARVSGASPAGNGSGNFHRNRIRFGAVPVTFSKPAWRAAW